MQQLSHYLDGLMRDHISASIPAEPKQISDDAFFWAVQDLNADDRSDVLVRTLSMIEGAAVTDTAARDLLEQIKRSVSERFNLNLANGASSSQHSSTHNL
ncbi:hypothetical protein [Marinobacterium lutimaris]|uniref:Uncharacterized protein n=1 Tax=Marinobacterium lutimaris TaxID=568106 RepID=A0A1H5XNY4_9GAMM|nr:hypothetical protein [Marinobacterium lutimaris]SEG13424.1 hypothetical protein SAMN05444390_1011451 [Marinobacterium lutimaris]